MNRAFTSGGDGFDIAGVCTIPGLTYRLLKATSLTGSFAVVIEADATTSQLTLEAEKTADPAAFYRVEVTK